jgi:hypothetical protein
MPSLLSRPLGSPSNSMYNVLWELNVARPGCSRLAQTKKSTNSTFYWLSLPVCGCLATFNSPDTLLWLVGSLSLPNRASADACSSGLNYLKRVQLGFLIVPLMNHAASFDSSARISCLLRFFLFLLSEGCCATSVNVPTTMAGSVVARKRNIECRTKVKTGCATCRSVIVDRSHHRSTPQDCKFRREASSAVIVLNQQ